MTQVAAEIYLRYSLFSENYYELTSVTRDIQDISLKRGGIFFLLKCLLKYVTLQLILS